MSVANPLLDQILSGENRGLQLLAAQGMVPLPPEELLPLQIGLTGSPDPAISGAATSSLRETEPDRLASFVRESAGPAELSWLGAQLDHPIVLEAVASRRDVPREVLVLLAERVPPKLQETIVHRQDAILDEPRILVALEANPGLVPYVKRRIWEYREHLLPRDKVPPKAPEEILAEAEALTEEELQEAIDEVKERHPSELEGDELKGLTDVQIRALPVPMRVKLARGANLQMRQLLIRDSNSQVATTVMTANTLSDQEVETIANSRSVCDEVIAMIPRKREWMKKYVIVKALVRNPKTQPAMAMRLIPRLTLMDLRMLAKDKNVPEAVRIQARRVVTSKQR